MSRIAIIFLLFTFLTFNSFRSVNSGSANPSLFDFILTDLKGKDFSFSSLSENKASVIVLVSPDCPIAQKYTLTLRNIENDYSSDGIHVYGIFPGTYYSKKDYKKFNNKYKVNFPLILDPDYAFVKELKGIITPQVFLVDNTGKILYNGAIDNWFFSLGKHRTIITENYLIDAIESVLSGQPIKVKKTEVVGCILEY